MTAATEAVTPELLMAGRIVADYFRQPSCNKRNRKLVVDIAAALREAEANALRRCLDAQPPTAEDPNHGSYDRGYFNGIMEYVKAIRSLLPKEAGK